METKDLGKTSTGIQPNVEALLSYLFGWITGLIFFLIETENKFVRFHALQSIITFGALTAIYVVLGIISGLLIAIRLYFLVSFFGIFYPVLGLVGLILWIILMVKAYQGVHFKLPVIGDFAEKKIAK